MPKTDYTLCPECGLFNRLHPQQRYSEQPRYSPRAVRGAQTFGDLNVTFEDGNPPDYFVVMDWDRYNGFIPDGSENGGFIVTCPTAEAARAAFRLTSCLPAAKKGKAEWDANVEYMWNNHAISI